MVNEEIYNQLSRELGPDVITKVSTLIGLPIQSTVLILATIMAIAFIWSLVWKAQALWRSAKLGSKIWFVILLIINDLGILEILYLFYFSKQNKDNKVENKKVDKKF